MDFRAIELGDKQAIETILAPLGRNDSSLGFANIFSLQEKYATQICIDEGVLYLRMEKRIPGTTAYFPPLGQECGVGAAIELLRSAVEGNERACLVNVTLDEAAEIAEAFPGAGLVIDNDRAYADYLYDTNEIATYGTPELGRKRRAVRKFYNELEGELSFAPLTWDNVDVACAYQHKWYAENAPRFKPEDGLESEHRKIMLDFDLFEDLGLEGFIATIDSRTVGYGYGCLLPGGAFDVMVLKSDSDQGALWAALLQEMAKRALGRAALLNLEEDLGLEGLRENKMRYHPSALLEKCIVSFPA